MIDRLATGGDSSMEPLRLAVVGVGHLGKEHARILKGMPEVELVAVADANMEQARAIAAKVDCLAFGHHRPLLQLVDAAVLAMPTSLHFQIASEFLQAGVPVLVEKPLALNAKQVDTLAEQARVHGTVLQVGHIERFNPAWERLQSYSMQPLYIECERLSGYTGRSGDIGVILDLMIHDLDLLLALVKAPVQSITGMSMSVFGNSEDVASAQITFANGCVGALSASRASMTARRSMRIWAREGFADLDFSKKSLTLMQPSDSVRRHGLDVSKLDPMSRARLKEDLFGRHLEVLELDCNHGPDGLTRELNEFVECVRTGSRPRASGEEGRDAVRLAMQVTETLERHSQIRQSTSRLFTPPAQSAAA